MNTLENTISMMRTLPETDLRKIQALALKLSQRHKTASTDEAVGKFLKPMSREDFLDNAAKAEEDIASGKYRPASGLFTEMMHRYEM